MSNSGKAGNGRGNSRKRTFKRHDKDNNWQRGEASRGVLMEENDVPQQQGAANQKGLSPDKRAFGRNNGFKRNGENARMKRVAFVERPKWIPPKMNTEPLPVPDCPLCGKPIRDISSAMADKDTGAPVHFDCVTAKIAVVENLDKNDAITYIGGGRFGIICIRSSDGSLNENQDFRIKRIIEWETKDKRAEWRSLICDHYSIT